MLSPGERAILSAASRVVPGTTFPEAAAVKSGVQEAPPLVAVHEFRAFAKVFSLLEETVSVDGFPAPGDAPVLVFTRLFAVRNALSMPKVLVQLAPTLPPLDMKEASAQTEAAVVTSFTTNVLPELMEPHGPRAVINRRDWLAEAAPPGCLALPPHRHYRQKCVP